MQDSSFFPKAFTPSVKQIQPLAPFSPKIKQLELEEDHSHL
jgi:hypothetical protein